MGVTFRVRNIGNGPLKIKYLPGAPVELLRKAVTILPVGGKTVIPAELTPFVDKAHLNRCRTLRVASVKEVRVSAANPASLPKKTKVSPKPRKGKKSKKGSSSKSKKSTKKTDSGDKTKNSGTKDKAPAGDGADSQKGGD